MASSEVYALAMGVCVERDRAGQGHCLHSSSRSAIDARLSAPSAVSAATITFPSSSLESAKLATDPPAIPLYLLPATSTGQCNVSLFDCHLC